MPASRPRERRQPVILALGVIGLALLVLPLLGLILRAPWGQLGELFVRQEVLQALGLSLLTATLSTGLSLILGIPLAVLLSHSVHWKVLPRRLLRAAITIPLVLPPVVGGIALLLLLGRRGILGQWLTQVGITIPFTTGAVVLAQTFVAMPFLVFAVEGALRSADRRSELAAASLGASPWQIFRLVTVPLTAPGIAAGAVLCFARALGEFGATALFAGNAPGVTRTMPLAIYTAFNGAGVGEDTAIALSLLLIVVAVAVLVLMRGWKADAIR